MRHVEDPLSKRSQVSGHQKLVLLVEDDIDAVELYGRALRRAGYEVVFAESLAEATMAAFVRTPDLVVLDGRLPDGDGLGLLAQWREVGHPMAEVPVIVVTGSADRQDIAAAFSAGADEFVPKPCCGNELALHVARALQGNRKSARLRRVVPT